VQPIRYSGLAPTPEQLQKMVEVGAQRSDELELGDVPQNEIRQEEFPDGVAMGITPTLRNEVNQIIWSTHWEYQKRILDQIESIIVSDRQWTIVRKIVMGVMTEQVERMRLLVGQRIRQEMYKTTEAGDNDVE